MLDSTQSGFSLVVVVLVFVSVVLLIEGLYLMWQARRGPGATKMARRLRQLADDANDVAQAKLMKQRMLSAVPALEQLLLRLPRIDGVERWMRQAGLDWTVSRLFLFSALGGMLALLAMTSLAHQSFVLGLIAGTIAACIPAWYVHEKRSRRLLKIDQQLPEALDLLSRALRAGHALPSGLRMIGDEMPEPIAGEFRAVHDEINFGVSLQQALMSLTTRVPSTDLRYFVVALLVQRDSGGNLTEILDKLSRLVRDRFKLLSKVRVLSAEGRLSAWILALLPFGLGALMNAMNPAFMAPLWTDPIGIAILKYTLALMAVGIVILAKIVKIRV
jgi:tight adherence protein B